MSDTSQASSDGPLVEGDRVGIAGYPQPRPTIGTVTDITGAVVWTTWVSAGKTSVTKSRADQLSRATADEIARFDKLERVRFEEANDPTPEVTRMGRLLAHLAGIRATLAHDDVLNADVDTMAVAIKALCALVDWRPARQDVDAQGDVEHTRSILLMLPDVANDIDSVVEKSERYAAHLLAVVGALVKVIQRSADNLNTDLRDRREAVRRGLRSDGDPGMDRKAHVACANCGAVDSITTLSGTIAPVCEMCGSRPPTSASET